jgi:pimeloyl-ACP methyl ester carboxylesterase
MMKSRTYLAPLAAILAAFVLLACWLPGGAFAAGNPRQGKFSGPITIGGGRELYLRCAGRGSPTVIMESGIHDSSDAWTVTQTTFPVPPSPTVFQGVARFTHVCIDDRPGTTGPQNEPSRSTPVPMPRKLPGMAADLHTLLMHAGLRAPVVLVGHSLGGLIIRYFSQTYRQEVRGMVFVDALGAEIKPLLGPIWPRYEHLANFPSGIDVHGLETIDLDGAVRAVQRAKPLPPMPLAVISKTEPFPVPLGPSAAVLRALNTAWPIMQNQLVLLEPQAPHILATGIDHNVQVHAPDLTTTVIRLIWARARDGG